MTAALIESKVPTKIGATIDHAINHNQHRKNHDGDSLDCNARHGPGPIHRWALGTEQRPHESTSPEDNLQRIGNDRLMILRKERFDDARPDQKKRCPKDQGHQGS